MYARTSYSDGRGRLLITTPVGLKMFNMGFGNCVHGGATCASVENAHLPYALALVGT